MSRKHLLREPQYVAFREDWWFYEQNSGLCIVVEFDDANCNKVGTRQVTIPWRRIRASLARKDKP